LERKTIYWRNLCSYISSSWCWIHRRSSL